MARTRGDYPYVRPADYARQQLARVLAKKRTTARTRRAVPPMPRWTARQRRLPLKLRKYEKK